MQPTALLMVVIHTCTIGVWGGIGVFLGMILLLPWFSWDKTGKEAGKTVFSSMDWMYRWIFYLFGCCCAKAESDEEEALNGSNKVLESKEAEIVSNRSINDGVLLAWILLTGLANIIFGAVCMALSLAPAISQNSEEIGTYFAGVLAIGVLMVIMVLQIISKSSEAAKKNGGQYRDEDMVSENALLSIIPFSFGVMAGILFLLMATRSHDSDKLSLYAPVNYTRTSDQDAIVINMHNVTYLFVVAAMVLFFFSGSLFLVLDPKNNIVAQFLMLAACMSFATIGAEFAYMFAWGFNDRGATPTITEHYVNNVQFGTAIAILAGACFVAAVLNFQYRYAPGCNQANDKYRVDNLEFTRTGNAVKAVRQKAASAANTVSSVVALRRRG